MYLLGAPRRLRRRWSYTHGVHIPPLRSGRLIQLTFPLPESDVHVQEIIGREKGYWVWRGIASSIASPNPTRLPSAKVQSTSWGLLSSQTSSFAVLTG